MRAIRVLQHDCAFLADVDVIEMTPKPLDRFGDFAAIVIFEPDRHIARGLHRYLAG